uniref:Uncharacterized protein n=1 Tax=Romanomermis culicivorax TaxID=13658 RepID=A0A915I1F6_ROMCU
FWGKCQKCLFFDQNANFGKGSKLIVSLSGFRAVNIVVQLCDNLKVIETIHVNRSKKFHANNVETPKSMPGIKEDEATDQLSMQATHRSTTKMKPL